jgi:hypothetical protein
MIEADHISRVKCHIDQCRLIIRDDKFLPSLHANNCLLTVRCSRFRGPLTSDD